MIVQNQYKKRHDTVARAVHCNPCKKYQMPCSNKWHEHQPQSATENENAKLLWDYKYQNRQADTITSTRLDSSWQDKQQSITHRCCSTLGLKSKAERTRKKKKGDKYQDLRTELRRLWDKPVEIVLIIIGALDTLPKSLKRNLEELEAEVAPGLLQKTVVLETAHIA